MKKRRIVLRVFPFNRLTFPLLLNVWERHGLDRRFEIRVSDGLANARRPRARPDDVWIYSFMTPHLPVLAREIAALRALGPERPLLAAGGPHVSGDQQLPLRLGFDRLFVGPGEGMFRRFGEELANEEPATLPKEPSIMVDGESAGRSRPRLGDAPSCRAHVLKWTSYLPISEYFKTMPPLEVMRGCHHACRYCQTGRSVSAKPLFRDSTSIASYVAELKRRGYRRAGFISPSALEFGAVRPGKINLEAVAGLLSVPAAAGLRFIEYGIFPSEIRPETISDPALEMLGSLVSHRQLTVGAQSGLDERLAEIGRGHRRRDIEQAAAIAAGRGFRVNLDFIFAFPGETADERRATIDFIRTLRRRYRISAHLHHFFPLAGSDYQWRRPSFLNDAERSELLRLHRDGIASDWWLDGEKRVKAYFRWLKSFDPEYFSRYW